ncbi:hypothetical protein H1P_390013 [Hyella patelloides LEGE 07179]|uniref:Uncharacterized protein n=1 Tax=Hyella patelloides LEGE 07179 TaxID=945734 RepID=A0A563VX26_9CYAN|nr:hypothetical protein [Hyella patelloides]VEP15945.1 hypothetical protein H1P_390013 [Hyella patelloides LEGE 07179]
MTKKTYSNHQCFQKIKPLLMSSWLQIQKNALWSEYWKKIRKKRPPREIHAFCIGLPKTGTNSIANMLECKTAHEPEKSILFDLYKANIKGRIR